MRGSMTAPKASRTGNDEDLSHQQIPDDGDKSYPPARQRLAARRRVTSLVNMTPCQHALEILPDSPGDVASGRIGQPLMAAAGEIFPNRAPHF